MGVYVGSLKISLAIAGSHSLKDKRMVIRRVKDRVRERLGVPLNEVGELDSWHRGELGAAVVSGDRAKVLAVLDDIVRVVRGASDGQIAAVAKDVSTFEAPLEPDAGERSDEPPLDADWIPASWRDEG